MTRGDRGGSPEMIGTRYTKIEKQRIVLIAKGLGCSLADFQRLATLSAVSDIEREWNKSD